MTNLSPIDNINRLAKLILEGKDPSPEEMHAALMQIRSERGSAVQARAEAKAKKEAKSAPIDIASLFKPKGE